MADLMSTSRLLNLKRHEHSKMVAQANIQAREIRILELQEEIERCNLDIDAQKKVIEESDKNIKLQHQEIEKEKAEADKAAAATKPDSK